MKLDKDVRSGFTVGSCAGFNTGEWRGNRKTCGLHLKTIRHSLGKTKCGSTNILITLPYYHSVEPTGPSDRSDGLQTFSLNDELLM